jgi:hypoxanthine phosphoribosyltransferase
LIHYFFVDFNNEGQYYRVGVDTAETKEVVEKYLQGFSQDVRYQRSQAERTRKDNGTRKTPVGVICHCRHCLDKINTFTKRKLNAQADSRHTTFQWDMAYEQAC